jgi:hypothetical protein
MKRANNPSEKIGELIDSLERIREELTAIQRAMEKLERIKVPASLYRTQKS